MAARTSQQKDKTITFDMDGLIDDIDEDMQQLQLNDDEDISGADLGIVHGLTPLALGKQQSSTNTRFNFRRIRSNLTRAKASHNILHGRIDELIPTKCGISLQEMQNRQQHGIELFSVITKQPPQHKLMKLLTKPSNWCILIDAICAKLPDVEQRKKVLSWLNDRALNALKDSDNTQVIDLKKTETKKIVGRDAKAGAECLAFVQAIGYKRVIDPQRGGTATRYILQQQPQRDRENVTAAHTAIQNTLSLMKKYKTLNKHWQQCLNQMNKNSGYKQHQTMINILKAMDFVTNYTDYYEIYRRLLPISELEVYSRDELVLHVLNHLGFKLASIPKEDGYPFNQPIVSQIERIYNEMIDIEKHKKSIGLTKYYKASTVRQIHEHCDTALLNYQLSTEYSLTPQQLQHRQQHGIAEFTKKMQLNMKEALNPSNWDTLLDAMFLQKRAMKHRTNALETLLRITNEVLLQQNKHQFERISMCSKSIQQCRSLAGFTTFLRGIGYVEDNENKELVMYAERKAPVQVLETAIRSLKYKQMIISEMDELDQRLTEAKTIMMYQHAFSTQQHRVEAMGRRSLDDPINAYYGLLKKCVAVFTQIAKMSNEEEKTTEDPVSVKLYKLKGERNEEIRGLDKLNYNTAGPGSTVLLYLRNILT